MSIKTSFSIKDLENLSGVKAHTIRMWEKRYGILAPERSDTNIRAYNHESLQKLLNVALLNERGIKISKIATMTNEQIFQSVRELALKEIDPRQSINSFKISMLNFDEKLFHDTYNQLLATSSFREIFLNVFRTFIHEIGLLWMSNSITPAHEHFISMLIKQKLLINIERAQTIPTTSKKTFVLFLPLNELHELGLLYIHLELLVMGHKSVYLGPSVPTENLTEVQKALGRITYISYFTVEPAKEEVAKYLQEFNEVILQPSKGKLHVLGRNVELTDAFFKEQPSIKSYATIEELLEII